MKELFGIDVSINNGVIDWRKAKSGGVDFAMIKASQGKEIKSTNAYLFADRQFATNINGAPAAGIPVGVYHYLTAATVAEAGREADYFLSVIAPYRGKISLWVAVDVEEDRCLPEDIWLLTTIVDAFVVRIRNAGYKAMIYTGRKYMQYRLDMSGLQGIDIWQAHWSTYKPSDAGDRLMIWQHEVRGSAADVAASPQRATVIGSVPGVTGAIDCNRGYFDLPATVPVVTPVLPQEFEQGDRVRILPGAVYTNGAPVPPRIIGTVQTVTSANTAGIYFAALVSRIRRDGLERV